MVDNRHDSTKGVTSQTSSCPCADFSSSEKIISALKVPYSAKRLIEWIEGEFVLITGDRFEKKAVSSRICRNGSGQSEMDNRNICPNRIRAVYFILNSIRDGCRHLLEDSPGAQNNDRNTNAQKSIKKRCLEK